MLGMQGITYRQLLDELNKLSNDQLDCDLAVELVLSEEGFSSVNGDVTFNIAGPTNMLFDDGHPIIVLQY